MATTAPPSYDAALSELEQLEKNPLSDTEKAKVQNEVTSKITSATSTSELMDEIKQLSANTIKIDEDMHKVETALTQVDNAGFNFPRKLAPEWKVIRAEWNTLLWDSRETASKTAMRMQVWRDVVLKRVIDLMNDTSGDPIDNMAEAVQLLKDFGDKPSPVKEVVENGASHSQGFINLQRKMNDFKDTFDGFTKAEQVRIEGQIASVRQQINSLNAEIQQCDQMVARLSRALGFTIFGTIVGAGLSLFAFGIFGPCIAIKVLIVGAIIAINQKRQLIEYSRRAEALRGQLGAKQAELRGLKDKLALLKKCEAQLAAQKVAIGDIASRVGQIGLIWAVMLNDANKIKGMIEDMSEETNRTLFIGYLENMQKLYEPLQEGCDLYATQVANALK